MTTDLCRKALEYSRRGFSVIPVNGDKRPSIPWALHQKQKLTEAELGSLKSPMIAIVTGELSGLLVIDCDSREGYEAIQALLPDALLLPIARTPRGGWHLYFRYPAGSKITVGTGILPNVDFRGEGGYIIAPPSINGDGRGYTWQEGLSLGEVDPPALPESIFNLLKNSFYKGRGVCAEGKNNPQDLTEPYGTLHFLTQGRRDDDLFHVANCLVKGGCEPPIVHYILDILSRNSRPPFPENEILAKIDSALKRAERRERNLKQEVLEWVTLQDGYWNLTETKKTLQILTKEEKSHLDVIIHRLKKDGIIEKYGNRAGEYRTVQGDVEEIDFLAASDDHLEISWPIGIERFVFTLPKSIIIVAGEPDAGKTAFLLNFARMNQDRHAIHYFSSEMGATELRSRLMKFDHPLESWRLHAKERAANFADVIQPDAVNIIDFLEIHDEFYKVGGFIKEIFDKLQKGIAVIALQKNKGADYGLGGTRGLEKARLYLTMGGNQIKIVKAKNWRQENVKPTGLALDFKLAAGCRFIIERDWYR